MPKKSLIVEPSEYDLNNVIADIEEIRKCNCQRFEMEHLTAIVYEDTERNICVGYKDITSEEFWIRGHMPGMPIMPGVIMCEAAAQVASFYVQHQKLMDAGMMGFGVQRFGLNSIQADYDGTPMPTDVLPDETLLALTLSASPEDAPTAAAVLADFETAYPESELIPMAKFRQARICIERLKETSTGMSLIEEIARDYPDFAASDRYRKYTARLKTN